MSGARGLGGGDTGGGGGDCFFFSLSVKIKRRRRKRAKSCVSSGDLFDSFKSHTRGGNS